MELCSSNPMPDLSDYLLLVDKDQEREPLRNCSFGSNENPSISEWERDSGNSLMCLNDELFDMEHKGC